MTLYSDRLHSRNNLAIKQHEKSSLDTKVVSIRAIDCAYNRAFWGKMAQSKKTKKRNGQENNCQERSGSKYPQKVSPKSRHKVRSKYPWIETSRRSSVVSKNDEQGLGDGKEAVDQF